MTGKENFQPLKIAVRHAGSLSRLSALLLAGVAFFSTSSTVFAGDSGANSGIEEVVVTAFKRAQDVQTTPSTVIVTSGEEIQDAGVTRLDQVESVMPGITMQAPSPGLFVASVRGLSSSPSNNSFEQTVGLFVDGIYAGHPQDYTMGLFDLQSVELLKGTQSAVLGKNTSVGAINIVTQKPKGEFGYALDYAHEFEQDSDRFSGEVNLPLTDTFAIRIAGVVSDEGGWIHYRLRGGDYPQTKERGLRGSFRWQLLPNLDWTAYAEVTTRNVEGQNLFLFGDTKGNAKLNAAAFGDPSLSLSWNSSDVTPREGYKIFGKTDPMPFDDFSAHRYSSILNYDWGGATLTATTGYSDYSDRYLASFGGMPDSTQQRSQRESDKAFSQELRLVSSPADRFNYIVGGYYYHDIWYVLQMNDYLMSPGLASYGAQNNGYRQTVSSWSGFASVNYTILDDLEFTGGLRYDNQQKDAIFTREIVTPGPLSKVYPPYVGPAALGRDDDAWNYSLQLRYEFDHEHMVYAGYFTGSRLGGFQAVPTDPGTSAYGSEESKTIEIGTKLGLPWGGYLNAALFNTQIDKYQFAYNTGINFIVRNDYVRSRGVDLQAVTPIMDDLTAKIAVTYADVVKTRAVAGAISGEPWAPKWSGSASLDYARHLFRSFDFDGEVSVSFRSREYLNDALSFPLRYSDGFGKLNLRLAVSDSEHGIELALVGQNLNDERVIKYAVPLSIAGSYYVVPDAPRTISLQLSLKH